MYKLKIKEVAEAKGLSQRQLFFSSRVDLKIIQRCIREPTKANITMETLDRLAMALDVDVSELIESVPPKPVPPPQENNA